MGRGILGRPAADAMLPALRLLMWGIAVALVVAAALSWPALPDRVPTHFDAAGQPDAWSDRSLALWLLMPLLAAALSALMDWSAQTIRRRPESPLVNLPYKDQDIWAALCGPGAEHGPSRDLSTAI